MMDFGNYTYIIYILSVSASVALIFAAYLAWKRRVLRGLVRGAALEDMVHGSAGIARWKTVLVFSSIIVFAFTLLRPRWGDLSREVKNEGSDVLIALDVSNSMLARDIEPSRLQRARDAVRWIAGSLKGDRIGLILFAGDAFLQCPLTSDTGAFMMFLDAAGTDSMPVQGTDIGRALDEGIRVFKKKRLTSRIFVLITDGEDHQGAAVAAADRFRDLDVSVYTIGVGRDRGEFIPQGNADEDPGSYLRDSSDELIRTRKNPDLLKKLAAMTGGSYIDITNGLSGLSFILEIISDQQKNIYGSRIIREKQERYQVFAAILILLLSVELMLPERKRLLPERRVKKD